MSLVRFNKAAVLFVLFCIGIGGIFALPTEVQANATVMRPGSPDDLVQWTCTGADCGTGHYEVENDVVTQPTAPSTATDYLQINTNNAQFRSDVTNPTDAAGTTIGIRLWIYADTGSNATIEFSLTHDNSTTRHALTTVGTGQAAAWFSSATTTLTCATYAASCQALLNALEVETKYIKSGGGPAANATAYAFYTDLDYTASAVNPPTVATNAESNVTPLSAVMNGTVSNDGGEAAGTVGFAWGTNASLSGGDTATTSESGSFATSATFNQLVSGLLEGVTYYYRAYATNSGGTGLGSSIESFTPGTDTTPSRKMRLFEGFRILIQQGGRIIVR